MHKPTRQPELYIALQDYDFAWKKSEIDIFITCWNDGMDLQGLKKRFKRDEIEIAVLILDLSDRGKIKPRKNGLFGGDDNGR